MGLILRCQTKYNQMFEHTISKQTKDSLERIGSLSLSKVFYLAGGTALALQLGHRTSLDLDFFGKKEFSENRCIAALSKNGKFNLTQKDWQTVHGRFNTTRVSFMHYPYRLLYKTNIFCGVQLADIRDIACMKLDAIATRGSKKDFIDIYIILRQQYSLEKILSFCTRKYRKLDYNILHLLKSLVYFTDADKDPMPNMFVDVTWEEVKRFLKKEVRRVG